MKYMLDTNICIYIIKKKPKIVFDRMEQALKDGLAISAITLAELEHGVFLSNYPEKNTIALNKFLSILEILSFDGEAAFHYGNIHADLQQKGTIIGQMDMLIAAHARSRGMIVVTNNTREFERVEGLGIENWVS
ncbi:MAG: type II toxin-antitoxin system VapC family toxin [Lachnoclostridium sp.]|jgi:tRNA(fMet)-specific endonuclease VapC|nr:type II toxin-antitoxin system VapC family toxin [Lachnoclostridium sp.]